MRTLWIVMILCLVMGGASGGVAEARKGQSKPTPTPGTQTRPAEDTDLEKRIERLEREVRALRGIIDDLSAQISTTRGIVAAQEKERHPKYPTYNVGENDEEIRSALAEGMTEDQVRKLIGEPDRIDRYAITGTVWYYGLRHVDFGYGGQVIGWFGF